MLNKSNIMENNVLILEAIKVMTQEGILLPILVTAMVVPIFLFLVITNFYDVKLKTKKKK